MTRLRFPLPQLPVCLCSSSPPARRSVSRTGTLLLAVLAFSPDHAESQVRFVADGFVGYHWFQDMGNGPGIDGSFGAADASGLQVAIRAEYWFPQGEEWEGAFEPPPSFTGSWSRVALTVEGRYRLRPSRRHGPILALGIGNQWVHSPHDWTEADITYTAQLGYEYWIGDNVGIAGSVLGSSGDQKGRIAFRIGTKLGVGGRRDDR